MNTDEQAVRFFHVCTDGTKNDDVFFCEEDYEQAQKITATVAFRTGVHVIADCHMTTHSHFTVWCSSKQQAQLFGDCFKHDYSIYVYRQHQISGVYRDIPVTVREIRDVWDLRRCVSYTLLNPVKARVVAFPEDYRWSSFSCYFNSVELEAMPVASMPLRAVNRLFHTHCDLGSSGLFVDSSGRIVLKSFIDYRFVERLFGSQTEFFKSLALTDSAQEELKYTPIIETVRFSDDELRAEAMSLARFMFGTDALIKLTVEQKSRLLRPLQKKTYAAPARLARILRMNANLVRKLLG
ncbi:MAG: hypothetical protein Q4G10_04760 [Bacteroidia bacterium]|nr:hypothetical protein [Bacteroidia bacterium]